MAEPEGVYPLREINGLNWLTCKFDPNTFQWVISRLANPICGAANDRFICGAANDRFGPKRTF